MQCWIQIERHLSERRCRIGAASRRKLLLVLDEAGSLLQAGLVEDESAKTMRETYEQIWRKPYGAPTMAHVDAGKQNVKKEMASILENDNVTVDQAGGEAHWQMGRVKRAGAWFGPRFNLTASKTIAFALMRRFMLGIA